MRLVAVLVFVSLMFPAIGFSQELPQSSVKSPSLAPMLKKVMPSIVSISGTKHLKAYPVPMMPGQENIPLPNDPKNMKELVAPMIGSGIIVDSKEGLILTNAHVTSDLQEIEIELADNRKFQATLIGHDKASDLALLKVSADNLVQATFADSDNVEVGDFVVAIGNPYGLSHTATFGIVSGIGRSDIGLEGYYDFIQTNADINMGNSGGGLVNMKGEIIGINTMILSETQGSIGLGFAIPANMARGIMAQLATHGHVDRGPLGVRAQPLTPSLAKAFKVDAKEGAVVYEVVDGTPAATAGIQAGDIILSMNGKNVKDSFHLRTMISMIPPGTQSDIKIFRNGQPKTISILMTDPRDDLTKGEDIFSGLKGGYFAETDPLDTVKGVRVLEVNPETPISMTELMPGDVIVAVNPNSEVTPNLGSLRAKIKGEKDVLLLRVVRDQFSFFVGVNKSNS